VDYDRINQLLNKGIAQLNGLMTGGAIVDKTEGIEENKKIKTFDVVKTYFEECLEQILVDKLRLGENTLGKGEHVCVSNLLQLVNLDNLDEFKKVRFSNPSLEERQLQNSPSDIESFLKSFGIEDINAEGIKKQDFFSTVITTTKENHTANVTINLRRIRELIAKGMDINKTDEAIIYVFDSNRAVNSKFYKGNFSKITKICRFLNRKLQEDGTHWYRVVASAIAMAKNPRIFMEITKNATRRRSLWGALERIWPGVLPDEFETEQILALQDIADKFGVGFMNGELVSRQLALKNIRYMMVKCMYNGNLCGESEKKINTLAENVEKELYGNFRKDLEEKYKNRLAEEIMGMNQTLPEIEQSDLNGEKFLRISRVAKNYPRGWA
jgi:hypothetical protein